MTLKNFTTKPTVDKLSKRQQEIFERRIDLYENRIDKQSMGFYTQLLTMATFPHRSPSKDNPVWVRKNNNYKLRIQQYFDEDKKEWLGFPSGSYPRLFIAYAIEQAVKTKSRKIYLGDLTAFMKALKIEHRSGHTRKRIKDQLRRLFGACISFEHDGEIKGKKFHRWKNLNISNEGFFFWEDHKGIDDFDLERGYILLTQEFFEAIMAFPLPIDLRILKNIKNSPLALDLYLWVTAKVYQVNKSGDNYLFIPWDDLHLQMGAEYGRLKDFIHKCKKHFAEIQKDYHDLDIRYQRSFRGRPGGIYVYRCNPSVIPLSEFEKAEKGRQKHDDIEVPKDPQYWKSNQLLKNLQKEALPKLSEHAIRECMRIVPGYDPYKLVEDWLYYWAKKGFDVIKHPDKAFLAFTRKSYSKQY